MNLRHRNLPAAIRAALGAVLALTLASPTFAKTQGATPQSARGMAGGGVVGGYLAGRFAHQHDDWSAAARLISEALANAPDDRTLMRHAVIYRLGDGRADAALTLARKLVSAGETPQVAVLLLATEAMRQGDLAAAASMLEKMGQGGSVWALVEPLFQAWISAAKGDFQAAEKALDPMKGRQGLEALRDLHMGMILDLAGRGSDAAPYFARLVETRAPLRVAQLVGAFYQREGRMDDVRALYTRFAAVSTSVVAGEALMKTLDRDPPPKPDARVGLASALFDLASALQHQNVAEAALLFGRLSLHLDPTLAVARLTLGDILMDKERYEGALTEYRTIERDPLVGREARLHAADALIALDRADEAVSLLSELSRERLDLHDAEIRLADHYRQKKRWEEAVGAYDEALRRISRSGGTKGDLYGNVLYARAISNDRAGHWPEAQRDLEEALSQRPDDALLLNYLGYSWIDRGINLGKAKAMVLRAVALRPRDGYIVDSLGWAQYKLGEYEAAAASLERAVELRATDATINDHLGDAFWRVGRRTEARFQWLRATRLATEDEAAIREQAEAKLRDGLPDLTTAASEAASGPASGAVGGGGTTTPATPTKGSGKERNP